MDFRGTLLRLTRELDAEGARWALIGGVALGLHGVPRTTFDIDLLVDEDDLAALDRVLGGMACRLEYRWAESSHFAGDDDHTCPPIDVLHARRPGCRGMLARARRIELEPDGPAAPVVEVEDLIGLKVQAMANDPERERQELVDVRAVLEAAALSGRRLDLDRVREYFSLFQRAQQLDELMEGLRDALT